MFYVIRSDHTQEVLGIFSRAEVLTEKEYEHYNKCCADMVCGCLEVRLRNIINNNTHCPNKLYPCKDTFCPHWDLEQITLAEYETYRALHGFKVFTRTET